MQWQEAVALSPRGEAQRLRQPHQLMVVDEDGQGSQMARPYYNLWEEFPEDPDTWTDWTPAGMWAGSLDALKSLTESPECAYGFLSPTGAFFACDYGQHMAVAEGLLFRLTKTRDAQLWEAEDELVKLGWAVLKASGWWWVPDNWTAAQRDWIWDWTQREPGRRWPGEFETEPRRPSKLNQWRKFK